MSVLTIWRWGSVTVIQRHWLGIGCSVCLNVIMRSGYVRLNEIQTEKEEVVHMNDCGSVKCLNRRLHECKKFEQAWKYLEEIHEGCQTRIIKGSGKCLKIVWGWRALRNIWGFFLFVFWDSINESCVILWRKKNLNKEQKGEKTQWVNKVFHMKILEMWMV